MPGESLDLDEVFERVLVDSGGRKLVFSIGKTGILWKLDRQTGKFLGLRGDRLSERLRQHRQADGRGMYRNDIVEQQAEQWVQACPSTEGGHNWQAMS